MKKAQTTSRKTISVLLSVLMILVCLPIAYLTTATASSGSPDINYDHVYIIGVDGAGQFFNTADTPNFDTIFSDGVVNYTATAEPVTISAQNWGSILCSVPYNVHQMTNDSISTNERSSSTAYPSIFTYVRNAMPDAVLASFCNWSPINYGLIENNIGVNKVNVSDDSALTDQICSYFDAGNKPNLFFVQFDSVDGVGHSYGCNSQTYYNQISTVDSYIGRIHNKLSEKGLLENSLFIVVSDHGETASGGHGGSSSTEVLVTLAVDGNGVTQNGYINSVSKNRDVAALALDGMGISVPATFSTPLPTYPQVIIPTYRSDSNVITTATPLPNVASSTLTNGNIYTVTSNMSLGGSASSPNAINIAENSTVCIYIAPGCTLTVNGANAVAGGQRSGCGIYVPTSSILLITGGGSLNAKGGNAAVSQSGATGANGQLSISGNWFQGGTGSRGGTGSSGASAAIGGMGGTGGAGGAEVSGPRDSCVFDNDHSGNAGNAGTPGSSATGMGVVYVLGTVSVTATAGSGASGGNGGAAGAYATDSGSGWASNYSAGGGGGGGGGGSTMTAAAIGGGSGGAGGGGAGGSGGTYTKNNSYGFVGGFGGVASTGGSNGTTAYSDNASAASGGAGGAGGARGTGGTGGQLYVSSTASCTPVGGGTAASGYGEGAERYSKDSNVCIEYLVSFDKYLPEASETSTVTVVYGLAPAAISVPTAVGYDFCGYYTDTKGQGTQYYDANGNYVRGLWTDASDGTLHAKWIDHKYS